MTSGFQPRANRRAKDSVFCDLFSHGRYLLELYRDLHPEDGGARAADLRLVTLDRVLTRGQYNDLGFLARSRFLVLVEAQSSWTPNIAVRMLFYLADTYRRLMAESGDHVYRSSPLELPAPELYVVYTGAREDVPGELSFARDIARCPGSALDVRVKVLRGGSEGILGQYVEFTRVFDESRRLHGPTVEAVEGAIDACIGRGVLREYLESRRKEVAAMMTSMLDREEAMYVYKLEIQEEATAKGLAKGRAEAHAQAIANLMSNLSLTAGQAMDALGIPEDERAALNPKLHDQ